MDIEIFVMCSPIVVPICWLMVDILIILCEQLVLAALAVDKVTLLVQV